MDFHKKTIGWIFETTNWVALTEKSTKSNNFKPFSKTTKFQITDSNDKTTGCFSTSFENNIFFKKVLIQISFRFK